MRLKGALTNALFLDFEIYALRPRSKARAVFTFHVICLQIVPRLTMLIARITFPLSASLISFKRPRLFNKELFRFVKSFFAASALRRFFVVSFQTLKHRIFRARNYV